MRKDFRNKVLAVVMACAMVVSGSTVYSIGNGKYAAAAEDNEAFTKVLEAEDIDLRTKWNDTSNITEGQEREVTLSDGRKLTVKDNGSMRPELTSRYLVDNEMGVGINIGNTLEAVHLVENKQNLTGTQFDSAWSTAPATKAYIDCVHSYGINTVRIPVAWSNGDLDDGTYTIRGALLDRVEEVVNYALDNGMYVIINDHWDNQWWGQFGACKKDENGVKVVDQETRDNAWKRYQRYWEQISERFKDYSDHLIFEGANEELGDRLNDAICLNGPAKGYIKPDNAGKDIETMGGNLKTAELYDTVNKINQKFVDVVRAAGGNNAGRHLLIPGYNTNMAATADDRFKMPEDIEANGIGKLFLSVHCYDPEGFALQGKGTYTKEDQKYIKEQFANLKRFSDAGYGIIIGECGLCGPSSVSGSVTQWFYDVYTEAAKYHAVPVLWDTGAFFDREAPSINYKDIAVFYNTINQANGSTDVDRITGGAAADEENNATIPDYLDKDLWTTPGLHVYLFYQTSTWDYRNAYNPLRKNAKDKHSWEYIQATGAEVTADKTKVTDVLLTGDGRYTVSIDGIDLSGANSFKMLGISTDIDTSIYSGVTVTDVSIKFDGEEMLKEPANLVCKDDDEYFDFMAINVYGDGDCPLDGANEDETLEMPQKGIEISFQINGLAKPLADIASGAYINPETGEPLSDNPIQPTQSPAPTQTPDTPSKPLKKGDSFTSGSFKYKVTKAAVAAKKGSVTLTGLTKKARSMKTLSVAAEVKDNQGAKYTVKAIGAKVFKGAKASSITLNKNIKSIPSSAFANCKKLSKLTLKAKLSKVSKNAFKGCKKKITVKGTSRKANIKRLKKTSYKKFK